MEDSDAHANKGNMESIIELQECNSFNENEYEYAVQENAFVMNDVIAEVQTTRILHSALVSFYKNCVYFPHAAINQFITMNFDDQLLVFPALTRFIFCAECDVFEMEGPFKKFRNHLKENEYLSFLLLHYKRCGWAKSDAITLLINNNDIEKKANNTFRALLKYYLVVNGMSPDNEIIPHRRVCDPLVPGIDKGCRKMFSLCLDGRYYYENYGEVSVIKNEFLYNCVGMNYYQKMIMTTKLSMAYQMGINSMYHFICTIWSGDVGIISKPIIPIKRVIPMGDSLGVIQSSFPRFVLEKQTFLSHWNQWNDHHKSIFIKSFVGSIISSRMLKVDKLDAKALIVNTPSGPMLSLEYCCSLGCNGTPNHNHLQEISCILKYAIDSTLTKFRWKSISYYYEKCITSLKPFYNFLLLVTRHIFRGVTSYELLKQNISAAVDEGSLLAHLLPAPAEKKEINQ